MTQAARLLRLSWRGLKSAVNPVAFCSDQQGAAAVEAGIFFVLLSLVFANVTDVSIYVYQRMQVENATHVAAQAAYRTCAAQLPATQNCGGLIDAMQSALKSTSLGANVTLVSGSPTEGYYCINSTGALQYVSDVSTKPADCTAAGMPALKPADYIQVQTTFTYKPLFQSLSVTNSFPAQITQTALLRLG